MLRAFFWNRKWQYWSWGGSTLLLLSLYVQTRLNLALNNWYGDFYDMLGEASKHSLQEFWGMLIQFMWLAMPYMLLLTITSFFARHYVFRWREAMTMNYLPRWRNVRIEIEGASQRIQEDTMRFADIMQTLGLGFASSLMTLIAFCPLLWELSKKVEIPLLKGVPGSLVWIALTLSIGATLISKLVGYKLPGLQFNNQKVEAAFRKELVLGEDDKNRPELLERLINYFDELRHNYYRLYLHYGYFAIWSNSYAQAMVIVAYVLMGPGLFTGLITLGILRQTANVFSQVQSGFGIFIDNWTTITELQSIWKRLHQFERNLEKYEQTQVSA